MITLLATVLVMVLVFLLKPVAKRFGWYDYPQGRKNHAYPIVVIGGLAMIGAFKLCMHYIGAPMHIVMYLLLALLILSLIGLLDDLYQLSFKVLFLTQILAGLFVIFGGGMTVQQLGNLFGWGVLYTSWLAPVFTLICLLGVINAINMADGMDGLAGSLSLVSAAWFSVLAWLSGELFLLELLLVLIGVILGFLFFNLRTPWRRVADIFMGNSGSMALGLLLTWFAIQLSGKLTSPVGAITSVWVMGIPLMDMARVMLRRIRDGKSPFVADHRHVHHMLSSLGYSVEQVVFIKASISCVMGGVGVLAWYLHVPDWVMFYGFIALFSAYFYFTGSGWRHVCQFAARNP